MIDAIATEQRNPRVRDGGRARDLALVVLSRWRIEAGYVVAAVALACARPTHAAIAAWTPLILAGLALRTWARGHLERRRYLTRSGPYAWLRHPLYVGSFLVGVGFSATSGVPAAPLTFAAAFAAAYWPKAIREDAFLRARYGDEHVRWAASVGAIVPRPGSNDGIASSAQPFAWRRVLRHREWHAWLGAGAALALLWVRAR